MRGGAATSPAQREWSGAIPQLQLVGIFRNAEMTALRRNSRPERLLERDRPSLGDDPLVFGSSLGLAEFRFRVGQVWQSITVMSVSSGNDAKRSENHSSHIFAEASVNSSFAHHGPNHSPLWTTAAGAQHLERCSA